MDLVNICGTSGLELRLHDQLSRLVTGGGGGGAGAGSGETPDAGRAGGGPPPPAAADATATTAGCADQGREGGKQDGGSSGSSSGKQLTVAVAAHVQSRGGDATGSSSSSSGCSSLRGVHLHPVISQGLTDLARPRWKQQVRGGAWGGVYSVWGGGGRGKQLVRGMWVAGWVAGGGVGDSR